MTGRPISWCSVEASTADGAPRLTIATYSGDAPVDRLTIDAATGQDVLDAVPRLLAGRLLLSSTTPLVVKLLADIGIDAQDEIVDLSEWEALLWPDGEPDEPIGVEERGLRLLRELSDLEASVASRVGLLGRDALPAERRLLGGLGDALLAGGDELAFSHSLERPETLRRVKRGKPVDPARVASLIGGSRGLAASLPHYERRDEQTAMATAVAVTIRDGGQALIEAGTGTGKSLAYLTPSLIHAQQTGEQVVVATHTRALQDQLADRDAPVALGMVTPEGSSAPRVAVLKGRGNYLCLRRWFAAVKQPPTSEQEASFLARTSLWVNRTSTGDRAEIPLRPSDGRRFSAISAEGEACDASRCVFQQRNRCFLYRARRNADAAHLVITNHALLMTDLVEGGAALPTARHLVVDEAHHLEDQATVSFSKTLSLSAVSAVLDAVEHPVRGSGWGLTREIESAVRQAQRQGLRPLDAEMATSALSEVRRTLDTVRIDAVTLFGLLHGVAVDHGGRASDYALTVRLTDGVRHAPAWSVVERTWDTLNARLAGLHDGLQQLADVVQIVDRTGDEEGQDEEESDLKIRITTAMATLREISALGGESFLNPEPDKVYWVESGKDSSRASIRFAPLDLAALLREQLYPKLDSLVLTSATLTSAGSFAYLKGRLGLPDADELALASPFDFERAAMVCTVSDIPEPSVPGYGEAVHDAIVDIALAANGRTLVLFTSLAAMNAARRAVSPILSSAGLSVVTQHEDGSAEQLADRLRSFDRTVVLGAAAFWEGIDVPGPALSALVIVRLPFAVPTDPIVAARGERFDNAFMQYSLPEAILRFRQGFGRLIRRRTDRGVCVVLDSRILSKRYGSAFLRALPPCATMTVERDELGSAVAGWLDRAD